MFISRGVSYPMREDSSCPLVVVLDEISCTSVPGKTKNELSDCALCLPLLTQNEFDMFMFKFSVWQAWVNLL